MSARTRGITTSSSTRDSTNWPEGEQQRRTWKLSPMDLESRRRWEEYTRAKEEMLERTNILEARW